MEIISVNYTLNVLTNCVCANLWATRIRERYGIGDGQWLGFGSFGVKKIVKDQRGEVR